MVNHEITQLFKHPYLSYDLKHQIYRMLWKHVYPINETLKKELLSSAYLISILNKIKHTEERKIIVESMNMEIIDNTHYLNNVLYNLYILPSTPTTISLNFKIHCSFHLIQHDTENESIQVIMNLDIDTPYYMSNNDKLSFIKILWSHLSSKTKHIFYNQTHTSVPITDMFLQSILT